jgi:hypothetical protein
VRKARRLGVCSLADALALAVSRGCRHYEPLVGQPAPQIPRSVLPDDELTILLLCGEHSYDPMAIRCAAQMARSVGIDPRRLAHLAVREKAEGVLAHIARAGVAHDAAGRTFWEEILSLLSRVPQPRDATLPHWTRFVSMPGRQRSGVLPPVWLTPSP